MIEIIGGIIWFVAYAWAFWQVAVWFDKEES